MMGDRCGYNPHCSHGTDSLVPQAAFHQVLVGINKQSVPLCWQSPGMHHCCGSSLPHHGYCPEGDAKRAPLAAKAG